MKNKGFLTIATGDIRYYKMAYNLLLSYRLYKENYLPFCIICDRENEFTKKFDDVIILNESKKSFLDKLRLPSIVPYEENIFIDADSLIYGKIVSYFDVFLNKYTVFTAFGNVYSLESKGKGWFDLSGGGVYKNTLKYVVNFHGGIYFISKCPELYRFEKTVKYICNNFYKFKFRYSKPCDESIYALAMAVHGLVPVPNPFPNSFIFYPRKKRQALKVSFKNNHNCKIIHYGNLRTQSPKYMSDISDLKDLCFIKKTKFRFLYLIRIRIKYLFLYLRFILNKIIKNRFIYLKIL